MQAMDRAEVIQRRKAERQRLIAERLSIPGDVRTRHAVLANEKARELAWII